MIPLVHFRWVMAFPHLHIVYIYNSNYIYIIIYIVIIYNYIYTYNQHIYIYIHGMTYESYVLPSNSWLLIFNEASRSQVSHLLIIGILFSIGHSLVSQPEMGVDKLIQWNLNGVRMFLRLKSYEFQWKLMGFMRI